MTAPALRMRCGACGEVQELDIADAREAGESAAAKLSDAEIAERARRALVAVLERAVGPSPMRSLAIARAKTMPDAMARELSHEMMRHLLAPG